MSEYLEFKPVQCKDCYRCLRECPVKAINIKEHHAQIIEEHCILCGHCTQVCPQKAKIEHSEIEVVRQLLQSGVRVAATVAPSFISSLGQEDFSRIPYASIRMYEGTPQKVEHVYAQYDVAAIPQYKGKKALVMGKLYRSGNQWRFAAIGDAYEDNNLCETIARITHTY